MSEASSSLTQDTLKRRGRPPGSKTTRSTTSPKKVGRRGAKSDVPATELVRVAKDELNLIELPWTALWKHEAKNAVLFHEWEMTTASGQNVKCSWRVAGDPVLGLPNASALRLFLVLIEVTREKGVSEIVHFTPYDLLKRLGWPATPQYYKMLVTAFGRLKGVQIHAQNCWKDAKTGSFARDAFVGILNEAILFNHSRQNTKQLKEQGGELPLSYFEWNGRVLESIKAGQLATYDLDFALSLQNDVALSIFRLLSKKTFRSRSFEMDLEEFYHRHLGMRPTRYPSKMKERLKPGHDELIARGFLESVEYSPSKRTGREKICYVVAGVAGEALPDGAVPESGNNLRDRIVALGVAGEVADSLINEFSVADIELQLDCLADRNAHEPSALFVQAVRKGWKPPTAYTKRLAAEAAARAAKEKEAREREENARKQALEKQQKEQCLRFYKELDNEGKKIVDARVQFELGDVFHTHSITKNKPQWRGALISVLADDNYRETLWERYGSGGPLPYDLGVDLSADVSTQDNPPSASGEDLEPNPFDEDFFNDSEEMGEGCNDSDNSQLMNSQPSLLFQAELYVDSLLEWLNGRRFRAEVLDEELEMQRKKFCPLLDDSEWSEVKTIVKQQCSNSA